jgi:hypothetical protein
MVLPAAMSPDAATALGWLAFGAGVALCVLAYIAWGLWALTSLAYPPYRKRQKWYTRVFWFGKP